MKKLVAVILTVVLAVAGGGLFHTLDVPAGWLTGAWQGVGDDQAAMAGAGT